MADLQEELQAILGDPQAMGQITAIARAITGGGPSPAPEADYVPVGNTPPQAPSEAVPGTQPAGDAPQAQGPDLSALLGMLGGGGGPDIDPRLIQIALRVYSEYSAQDNEKAALLSALKPFLRKERLEKMEKAERVARLSRLVRVALRLLKEEGENHV